MKSLFPLRDVALFQRESVSVVENPSVTAATWQVGQHEFAMQMEGVGDFYVREGNYVEFSPSAGADPEWVDLCLKGRVLVALLHQRKTINFHASSFIHEGKGIMIMGETGAGKSSLTASFTLSGAGFLSDDLTPVIFRKSVPYIWPVSGTIKLTDNTIGQLNINPQKLTVAETGTGKNYLHIGHAGVEYFPLHSVFKIEITGNSSPEFYVPAPAEKFSLLRSEICSWEMLAGMPETEAEYLHQLLRMVQQVNIVRVMRPPVIEISTLHKAISDYIQFNY